MNPIEIFMSLDLEMNQPSRRIIQIGACVGNIKTGAIFEKISLFVNPYERLNPYITDLTKITQEDVDNGYTLEEAYRKLQDLHSKYGAFINCITWGGGDSQELLTQLKEDNPSFEGWCFGRRWIDTKTLFVSWRFSQGQPIQGGLAKSMLKVGLKFEGQKHNATDDAVNTFKMYARMLRYMKKEIA
jgi:inhibitor of KinA sporulation pathway (predicted exonuclease)